MTAKHCPRLSPSKIGVSLSTPCYTTYGSVCVFRCTKGHYLEGNSNATCSLVANTEDVEWVIGKFSCKGNVCTRSSKFALETPCVTFSKYIFNWVHSHPKDTNKKVFFIMCSCKDLLIVASRELLIKKYISHIDIL